MFFARFSIFVIYAWFGILKVLGESPATPLVKALFENTIGKYASFVSFDQFILVFGAFEVLIGILYLIPRFQKIAFALLVVHLVMTAMPLIVLPVLIWTKDFVPTLEGQYIIKNVVVLALALLIRRSSY